ncbi:hypothetical protein ACIHCQ_27720 [Streptomyces sp. NPDC052236]|uniref:hypothetical protein n=1 Tax=Streptomyces sp. NPDC052236 TaxID=3365686 RepID=UPI0037CF01F2
MVFQHVRQSALGVEHPAVVGGVLLSDGREHTDDLVVRLVGNHSFVLLEAEERGLRDVLHAEFPLPGRRGLVDALVYCDMTTPSGTPTSCRDRIAEILNRYGAGSFVGRFIRRAEPEIKTAVERVERVRACQ